MVYKKLAEDDKIIIKYLRQKLGYKAKRIIKDHPEKIGVFVMWATGLKELMKQVTLKGEKDQGDLEVAGLLGLPDPSTPNEISKLMNIPRTSIRRIIAEDLKLQPFKKIKGQRIDSRTKDKRIERCPNLLRVFTKQVLETAFFSDEKIFKVT